MSKENQIPPHSIKKLELVAAYVQSWIEKLMNNSKCREIVFIDCMCNSGIYKDSAGMIVEDTLIRIARIVETAIKKYHNRQVRFCFNDRSDATRE